MLITALMIACSTTDTGTKDTSGGGSVDFSAGDATAGAAIYSTNCESCHAAGATGGSGPDLTEPFTNDTDDSLADTIKNGVSGTSMPGFSSSLSDQDVADVIAYVHSLVG